MSPVRDRPATPVAGAGQRGFTLIELMMALAVLVVVAAFTLSAAMSTLETYRRSLATRHLLSQFRQVQSLAVTRGDVFGMQWGGHPAVSLLPGHYRIVRDTTGSCGIPSPIATPDGVDVVTGWTDLARDFPGVVIASVRDRDDHSLGAVMFNPMGASVNTCTSVAFPLTVTVADGTGNTEEIQISRSGIARLL